VLSFSLAVFSHGALQLPSYLASHMVLEAELPNMFWGTDLPGSAISVSAFSQTYNTTADAGGHWSVTLAAQPESTTPVSIAVSSGSGDSITLEDVLVGATVICSGQSNQELTVDATINWMNETADADALGATVRLFQVAMLDSYAAATTPQANLTASIPWARASTAGVGAMSGLCYYFGAELALKHPSTPIGVIASSWGGTAIQPWMSPAAMSKCAHAAPPPTHEELAASGDPGLAALGRALLYSRPSTGAVPTNSSCLYNSMIAPLMLNPKRIIAWVRAPPPPLSQRPFHCFSGVVRRYSQLAKLYFRAVPARLAKKHLPPLSHPGRNILNPHPHNPIASVSRCVPLLPLCRKGLFIVFLGWSGGTSSLRNLFLEQCQHVCCCLAWRNIFNPHPHTHF
jgi:hypothetical protein